MKFTSRAYNKFEINSSTKSSVIKISEEIRLKGEAEYYGNLPNDLKIFFPRLLEVELNAPYKLEIEYYAYNNLGNLMVSDVFNKKIWNNIFPFIFTYINAYKASDSINSNIADSVLMFIEKTEIEYNKLVENFQFFNKLKDSDIFILNGRELKSFKSIWPKIKDFIYSFIECKKFYFIHGDLCFSNILYGENSITNDLILKMIDPRGVFGKTKFFGDFYYDLAKISHSCNGGYEYLIYDKFKIITERNIFNLSYENEESKKEINNIFLQKVKANSFNIEKIKVIEGCIFIGMCARHYDSLDRQKAMFIKGLEILNNIYETI